MQQATSAGGAAVSITLAAVTGPDRKRVIDRVDWSYSAAPTGGRLTIASGAQATYDLDIAAAGPGVVDFSRGGFKGLAATSLVVTLAGGGGAVVGKLNIPNDWQE